MASSVVFVYLGARTEYLKQRSKVAALSTSSGISISDEPGSANNDMADSNSAPWRQALSSLSLARSVVVSSRLLRRRFAWRSHAHSRVRDRL